MIPELKTLVVVAREGTFAAAGDKVGLTQAAVSAQMKRLEAELGFALFQRTGRSCRLNDRGRQTLAQAKELLRLYRNLGSESLPDAATSSLTVGAIDSVQRSPLPDVLMRFQKAAPGCRLRVITGLSPDLFNQVDAGEIEIAALIQPPFALPNDLRWITLAREPFRLLVPRHVKGGDWADILSTQPFIRYERAAFGGRQVDRFLRAAHISVNELCELGELNAIIRLVARGAGVALVPQTVDHVRWPAGVRAVDMGEHTFFREIGIIHRAAGNAVEGPGGALIQLFIDAYGAPEKTRREGPRTAHSVGGP
jgi:DNA-binding transcriptional LysR family regulator